MRNAEREALAARVLSLAPAGTACEVIVATHTLGLTRFTHNAVHQNLESSDAVVRVRVVDGERTGVAETNVLDDETLRACVAHAKETAAFAPADPDRAPLAANPKVATPDGAFAGATASASPAARAQIVADISHEAELAGLWAAGYASTTSSGVTVANSMGTMSSFEGTDAVVNVKANGDDATGYAEAWLADATAMNAASIGQTACGKATRGANPAAVDPGTWTVILEPAAFGELLSYLSEHFSAQSVDEGSSFLCDGLDRAYAGPNVFLSDDFTHPLNAGQGFDYEGYPRERVPLLEGGVARGYVTDATWARKLGRPNTGHGLPAPNAEGPQPLNLVVAAGTKSIDELIAETDRGLLISRFWYIRPVDQRKTIVTGMTRDGTFLIDKGRVAGGVRNMRFNQSILGALEASEFSNRQHRTGGYAYSCVVPAVKIDRFTFSSVTAF